MDEHVDPVHKDHSSELVLIYGVTRTSSWHATAAESGGRDGSFSVHVGLPSALQLNTEISHQTEHRVPHKSNWGPKPHFQEFPSSSDLESAFPSRLTVEANINDESSPQTTLISHLQALSHLRALESSRHRQALPPILASLEGSFEQSRPLTQAIFVQRLKYSQWVDTKGRGNSTVNKFFNLFLRKGISTTSASGDHLNPGPSSSTGTSSSRGQTRTRGGGPSESDIALCDPLDILLKYLHEVLTQTTCHTVIIR